MTYSDKKSFSPAQNKSFGSSRGKPFRAKPARKVEVSRPGATRSYGKKPFGNKPIIRSVSKIGERAPQSAKPFRARASFNSKWAKPSLAAKSVEKKAETSLSASLKTGWGAVANWYHDAVEEKGSYQRELILPNLLRLMDIKKGETILDLACGEGFFARRFNRLGAKVIASDISQELIAIARREKEGEGIQFEVAPADKIPFVVGSSIDKAVIVLALQNIENVAGVFQECARVLKSSGRFFFVLNHPAFRVPKASSWGWDTSAGSAQGEVVQYRRVDRYMSERREKIAMHPGAKPEEATISFHRPLQYFVKALKKNGFALVGMEEWTSDRKSQPGPRAEAENRARIEIPLFMLIEARKFS